MTIDSAEAAGDPTDIFENWEDRYETVIWNGREITILDQQRTDQFITKAQAIIQSLNEEKKHQSLVHHVKQLDSLEERAFDFAPAEHEFILINSQLSESELIQCGLFKRVWDGMRKAAKKAAKAFKKAIDAVKKAAEEFAHGTKKAAEKVADFVKEHKKETLIVAAIIAAIAGAYIISGALSGGAATTGGGTPTRRKEDEKDDKTSPPSDPPPLPDWVSDLLKSTAPDFSPDKLTEASLENAKKEAHNAWNLFNNLKSDTENGLNALKTFEPEFNPSSHAVNTILNTVLQDPQKYEFSKNLISSQSWTDIIQSGHEQIDRAFLTLVSSHQPSIPPPSPPKPSPTFLDKIRLGLEIIGRGMMEPELLDPNSPIDPFFKDEQKESENISKGQSIGNFFETIRNALKNESETIRNEINDLKLYDPNLSLNLQNTQNSLEQHSGFNTLSFFQNTITPVLKTLGGLAFIHEPLSSLAELSKPQISRYFETEGVKRDHMLITCIFGMYNSFEDGIANLNYAKKLSDSDLCIEGVYNHTNGPLADPAEAFLFNYFGYSPITQDLLIQKWTEFHEKNRNNSDAKILHFCHSQGAIHTKNALLRLPEEIRNRIIVVAIAPATVVPRSLCYNSFNYASKNDIVPCGELLAAYWRACGLGETEVEEMLINASNMQNELIWLTPHEKATGSDHGLQSPTFTSLLKFHFDKYKEGHYR